MSLSKSAIISAVGAGSSAGKATAWSALWTFPAVLGSALVIAWGAEAAQFLISQGMALAILAWLQTLPEFAVEAVIGYLSAPIEWSQLHEQPLAWKDFWYDSTAKTVYFIGKDNIPFHTIIWPAMLLGYGGLDLPYDVPANQYVNFAAGQKQSKSKGTGTWVLDLLDGAEAYLRFLWENPVLVAVLTANLAVPSYWLARRLSQALLLRGTGAKLRATHEPP